MLVSLSVFRLSYHCVVWSTESNQLKALMQLVKKSAQRRKALLEYGVREWELMERFDGGG